MATAAITKTKRAAKAKPAAEPSPVVTSIKGFNRDLTCRGFQFELGKSYTATGKIEACGNGFHACPDDLDPLTVFQFYSPGTSRYCVVDQSGEVVRHKDDKAASATIFIRSEITVQDIIDRAVKFRVARAKVAEGSSNSGTRGAASNSGYSGVASNSGNYGAASNSGNYGAASNSGYYGAASNSGNYGAASNSGYSGAASNSGNYGAASNSGYSGAAMSHAYGGKVMCAGDGQALYCSELDGNYKLVSNACGITGRDGIEAGKWYTCKADKLVECAS